MSMHPTDQTVGHAPAAARVHALVQQMTVQEKLQMVTGYIGVALPEDPDQRAHSPFARMPEALLPPSGAIGSDGYVPAVDRLGIPALHIGGSGAGVTNLFGRVDGASVAYPSPLAQAATWNRRLKRRFGRSLGAEARSQGLNVMIAGAANVIVEPRGGRSFEYHGEDPVLCGLMVAEELRGTQEAGVVATVKHLAGNFQETARFTIDTVADEVELRESELLAFELAVTGSGVGAVMGSYNLLNGTYACEDPWLLQTVLRDDWGFRGWVMSDWGAAHSTAASANAGLDHEAPPATWFGPRLGQAVESGTVPPGRLDEMVTRIVATMDVHGLLDDEPIDGRSFDRSAGLELAQEVAEESMVLLTNDGTLPLGSPDRVVVIGAHADRAVPSGGGSAAVQPFDGAAEVEATGDFTAAPWLRSSLVDELGRVLPAAAVSFDPGESSGRAAQAAAAADVAIVVVHQAAHEGSDAPDLSLPDGQDDLVVAVAAAAPRTIVVLETGGIVRTPWHEDVGAVVQAWFPGHRGARALARVLTGAVNPSGKLPVSIPAHEDDLPYAVFADADEAAEGDYMDVMGADLDPSRRTTARYERGLGTGYKWFDRPEVPEPAFAFGHGLSYTTFEIADLRADLAGDRPSATVTVDNTGEVAGAEVVQVYVTPPQDARRRSRRLAGWAKVHVEAGREQVVTVDLERRALAAWDTGTRGWVVPPGAHVVEVGSSSASIRDRVTVDVASPA